MVKAIFKDYVIATAGPNEHSPEKLKSWTELRKGRFSLDMDESVTHLLCTDDQFKARNKNQRSTLQPVHPLVAVFPCILYFPFPHSTCFLVREREYGLTICRCS